MDTRFDLAHDAESATRIEHIVAANVAVADSDLIENEFITGLARRCDGGPRAQRSA